MALSDEVKLRYDDQELVELTNTRDNPQTTILDAKLDLASTAAISHFRTHAQQTFDLADVNHVEVASELVMAVLQKWSGSKQSVANARFDRAIEQCESLASITVRARIVPVTTSQTEHSVKTDPFLPDFDDERFADQTPEAPLDGQPNPDR